MKSFIEYVQMREGEGWNSGLFIPQQASNAMDTAKGAFQYHKSGNNVKKLEDNATQALEQLISHLKDSQDHMLNALYNNGYAHQLWKFIDYVEKRREPATPEEAEAKEWTVGSALAGVGGAAVGALAGAGGALAGGYGAYKVANAWQSRSKDFNTHSQLEDKAIKALQALSDYISYEKGAEYYSEYAKWVQYYINWMQKAKEFINSGQFSPGATEKNKEPSSYVPPRARRSVWNPNKLKQVDPTQGIT